MAEFNRPLFNDGLFDGNYVLGARGTASAGCVATVLKTGPCVTVGCANAALRAGLITASTVGVLAPASANCEPARVRNFSGAVINESVAPCDGVRMRTAAAHGAGAADGLSDGRRLRTSQLQAFGIAMLAGAVEKLAFPPLAQGLRVRRWSKPTRPIPRTQ